MNHKKKPDYDPEEILQSLMDAVVDIYTEKNSLRPVAEELELNSIKVRKLLITANYCGTAHAYHSDTADIIKRLQMDGKSIPEIMSTLNLSKSSVNSYLPYSKIPYKADELSSNAERIRKYRKRKEACEKLSEDSSFVNLWNCIVVFQGYLFRTSKRLKFRYVVNGSEMKIDRKEKTVTKSSVEMAYERTLEMDGVVTGPKKLGVFGSSYLYPVFMRIGLIGVV